LQESAAGAEATIASPVPPVLPVSVAPEDAFGSAVAGPLLPEPPPSPELAVDVESGTNVAVPLSADVAVPDADELPESPDAATPCAVPLAVPVLPEPDVLSTLPASPDVAPAVAAPWGANAKLNAGPVMPAAGSYVCPVSQLALACPIPE